jgi:hypothetical protein
MKTLKDHVILYDAVCPMCNLYTKGFVKSGMLDENGRLPYQQMPDRISCLVDQNRFTTEIALVDTASGNVSYGVESLVKIITHSFPILRPVLQNKISLKILDIAYKFISFNRRVIAPSKKDEVFSLALDPAFHRGFRIGYLCFTWLLSAFILYKYSSHLPAILPRSNFYREFLVCGGQLVWQFFAVHLIRKESAWDYLGNMMTISFGGSLLLGLVMVMSLWLPWGHAALYAGLFGLVVFLMLLEHIRRTRLLGLDSRMTISWAVYRLLVLLILFN